MTKTIKSFNLGWLFLSVGVLIPLISIGSVLVIFGSFSNSGHSGFALFALFVSLIIAPMISFLCGIILPFKFSFSKEEKPKAKILPLSANLIGLILVLLALMYLVTGENKFQETAKFELKKPRRE